jgi:PAS domain S-box-containing protein
MTSPDAAASAESPTAGTVGEGRTNASHLSVFLDPENVPSACRLLLMYGVLPLAYVFGGWIGLHLAVPPGYATAVFIPAGIAITATFLSGATALLPIFLGSLVLNVWVGHAIADQSGLVGLGAAASIATASTLQAAVGGAAFRRSIGYPAPLDNPRDILLFLTLSPAVCLISATLSIAAVRTLGVIEPTALTSNWVSWWVGDTLGVLVTLPIMLAFIGKPQAIWRYRRRYVAIPMLLSFGLFVIIYVSFQSWAVLAAGALSTGLLGAFLLLGTGHAFRFEELTNKLRRSEAELNTVIGSTPFMLTRCSRDLRYRFVSPAYAEMLGRRPEDIIGLPILTVLGEKAFSAIVLHVEKVLEGHPVEYESEVHLPGAGNRFLHAAYVPERDEMGQVQGWVASILDATERKRAEETERMLVREVEHRSNNLLAVIQAIAHRSLAGKTSLDEARIAFQARLQALARTNVRLTEAKMRGLTMDEVVHLELDPFAARIAVDGDEVSLSPQRAQSFALVLHELATNAVKYGALSCSDGNVEISWRVVNSSRAKLLTFKWQERNGPPVILPRRTGFGSSLVKATFPQSQLSYPSEGLICEISCPLDSV